MVIFDVKWQTQTAGPSPYDNNRTELFLFGCHKAASGMPCKGCFNKPLWQPPENAKTYTPKEVAEKIIQFAPYPFLTLGGGEPLDQIAELAPLCYELKKYHFNIICYTWRNIEMALKNAYGLAFLQDLLTLMPYVDAFIDGPYEASQRIYQQEADDGFLNSIGSANQHIVLCQTGHLPLFYEVCQVQHFYYDEIRQKLIVTRKDDIYDK